MRTALLSLACSWPVLAGLRVPPPPVAMVTELQGRIRLESQPEPLGLTAEVPAEAPLILERGSEVSLLAYGSGAQILLTGPGRFTLDGHGAPHGPARGIHRIQGPELVLHGALKPGGLAQASLVMREPSDFTLVRPDQPAVREARPTFQWDPIRGTGPTTFTLRDENGKVCFTAQAPAASLELPATASLEPGKTYRWELAADLPGVRTLSASGEVTCLRPDQIRALQRLQREASQGFRQRLLYAATLQAWGLTAEARTEWKRLAAEHPEDAALKDLAR